MNGSNNDVDTAERARALHRVVRAMHDGECPSCHQLWTSEQVRAPNGDGHECPGCGFVISAEESREALKEFAVFMDRNLDIFEHWRKRFLHPPRPVQ